MTAFKLDDEKLKRLKVWKDGLDQRYAGAIGGRFTYSFTPTSLGVIIKVKDDLSAQELDLTDYFEF